MNGFKIAAAALRQAAKEEPAANAKDLEAKARLYDIVGELSDSEHAMMFDSGAFNDIVRGYVGMLLDGWQDVGEEKKDSARAELSGLFDEVSAAQALAYYRSAGQVLEHFKSE